MDDGSSYGAGGLQENCPRRQGNWPNIKNGIRAGDWVEINGVGGEVVEIGLFRTALLETGNWTDKGHPTGRRVTFINNFAITGQYF